MKTKNKKKKNSHRGGQPSSGDGCSPMTLEPSTSGVCTPDPSAVPPPSTRSPTANAREEGGGVALSCDNSSSLGCHHVSPFSSSSSVSQGPLFSRYPYDPRDDPSQGKPPAEASIVSPWIREESCFAMIELSQAQELVDGEIRRLIHAYLHSFNLRRGAAKIQLSSSSVSLSSSFSSSSLPSLTSSLHEDGGEVEKKEEEDRKTVNGGTVCSSCCADKEILLSEVISPPYRGRRPVRAVVAPRPFPSFRASIVDGYAVQHQVYRHHPKGGRGGGLDFRKGGLGPDVFLRKTEPQGRTGGRLANYSPESHGDTTATRTKTATKTTSRQDTREKDFPSSLALLPLSDSQNSTSLPTDSGPASPIVLRIVGEIRAGSNDIKALRHVQPRQRSEDEGTGMDLLTHGRLGEDRGGHTQDNDEADKEGLKEISRRKETKSEEAHHGGRDESYSGELLPTCVYVTTGARVANQYTAVIPVEDCRVDFNRSLCLPDERVWKSLRRGENIRPVGSDVPEGLPLLDPGQSIGPAEDGVLASFDVQSLEVYRHLNVHILAIGDELISRRITVSSNHHNSTHIKSEEHEGAREREASLAALQPGEKKSKHGGSFKSSSSTAPGETTSSPVFVSAASACVGTSSAAKAPPEGRNGDVVYDSNSPTIAGLIDERCPGVSVRSTHLLPDEAQAVQRLLVSLATAGGREVSTLSTLTDSLSRGSGEVSTCCPHQHQSSSESTGSILKCPCQWCEEVNANQSRSLSNPPQSPSPLPCCSSPPLSVPGWETKEACAASGQKKRNMSVAPDVLISTGGVSMGAESDCVKLALLHMEKRSKADARIRKDTARQEEEEEKKKKRGSSPVGRHSSLDEGLFATCRSGCCRLKIQTEVHFGRINVKPGKPAMFATVKVFSAPPSGHLEKAELPQSKESPESTHHHLHLQNSTESRSSSSVSSSVPPSLLRTLLVFALPGNPCSSWVLFHLLVEPALNFFSSFLPSSSLFSYTPPHVPVVLASPVHPDRTRPEFQRALVCVTPSSKPLGVTPATRSHRTASLGTTACGAGAPAEPPLTRPSPVTPRASSSGVDVSSFHGSLEETERGGHESLPSLSCANGVAFKKEEEEARDFKGSLHPASLYLTAYPTGPHQQSSRLLSCCMANSLLLIPPRTISGRDVYETGEVVEGYLLHAPYSSPPRNLLNLLRLQNQLQGQLQAAASRQDTSHGNRLTGGHTDVRARTWGGGGCRCGGRDDASRHGKKAMVPGGSPACGASKGILSEVTKESKRDQPSTHVVQEKTRDANMEKDGGGSAQGPREDWPVHINHEECHVAVEGAPHSTGRDNKTMKADRRTAPHQSYPTESRKNDRSDQAGNAMSSRAPSPSPDLPLSGRCCRALCRLGIVVVSDRCSRGLMKDECVSTVYTTLERAPKVRELLSVSSPALPAYDPTSTSSSSPPEGNPTEGWLVVPDEISSIQKALLSFLCECHSGKTRNRKTNTTAQSQREGPHFPQSGPSNSDSRHVSGPSTSQGSSPDIVSHHHARVQPAKALIVVCGGTGLAVRDVTPQALLPLLSVRCTGLEHLILQHSLQCTPLAALGRPCVGIATCGFGMDKDPVGSASLHPGLGAGGWSTTEGESSRSDLNVTQEKETSVQSAGAAPATKRESEETTRDQRLSQMERPDQEDSVEKEASAASRARSGTSCGARALVLILPGSPKAVRECIESLVDVLPHALELL